MHAKRSSTGTSGLSIRNSDVLQATSREYFRMMQEYLYEGQVNDPFDVPTPQIRI